eukprot:Sspe_Gene.89663::Locus_61383_Transcript_1_1_Confidence_1.000_Length_890::g.89663::m.89663
MIGRFWEGNDDNIGVAVRRGGEQHANRDVPQPERQLLQLQEHAAGLQRAVAGQHGAGGLTGWKSAALHPNSANRVFSLVTASTDGYYRIRSRQGTVLDSWG